MRCVALGVWFKRGHFAGEFPIGFQGYSISIEVSIEFMFGLFFILYLCLLVLRDPHFVINEYDHRQGADPEF